MQAGDAGQLEAVPLWETVVAQNDAGGDCVDPVRVSVVAGAGFEPAAFRL